MDLAIGAHTTSGVHFQRKLVKKSPAIEWIVDRA